MSTIKALKLPGTMRRFAALDRVDEAIAEANAREWYEEEFEAVFATEAPVSRWFGREVLGMGEDEVDLDPLMRAGSILRNHSMDQPVGIPVRAYIQDGAGRVRFRFANTARGKDAYDEVTSGAIRGLSVGYAVQRFERMAAGSEDEPDTYRATRWSVHEVSITPTPADPNANFGGRSAADDLTNTVPVYTRGAEIQQEAETMAVTPQATPAPTPAQVGRSADDLAEIRLLARGAGMTSEDVIDLLQTDQPTAAIKAAIRAKAIEGRRDDTNATRATGGASNDAESLAAAIPDAILVASRAVKADGSVYTGKDKVQLHPRAAALSGLKPSDMLRSFADSLGIRTAGVSIEDIMHKVSRRSHRSAGYNTTSDFTTILENTLNKMVAIVYQAAPTTYRAVARIDTANDLRTHNLYKTSGTERLGIVGESGEVRTAQIPDGKKETLTPYQFAKMISITDRVFINDDMRALTDTPRRMAEAASYSVEEYFWWNVLNNGVTNEDGIAFFDTSTHKNLITSGVGSGPSVVSFDAVVAAMMNQVDHIGRPIRGATPAVVVVPPALLGTALSLRNSEIAPGATNNERNRFFQTFDVIANPLLNTAGSTYENELGALVTAAGNPAHWYAFSDPNILPAAVVAFQGGETPQVLEDRPLGILGTQYQVSLNFGVSLLEWRAAVKYQNHSVG